MRNSNVTMLSADDAIDRLLTGNKRYISQKQIHPNQTLKRREELCQGQFPFAVILGCSDSRIPPELIFDQGLGDLFVVRVAGNIIDNVVLGSIEYAVAHLHTPLVMVLGHSKCGAVEATVAGGDLEGHLSDLTEAILPAMKSTQEKTENIIDDTARANAKMVAEQLTSILSRWTENERLMVVPAFYNLDTGLVEIL